MNYEEQYLPLPDGIINYSVTGVVHGSIVAAESEQQAREIFTRHYDEEIISIHVYGKLPMEAIL